MSKITSESVLRFVRDSPERSPYCLEGVSGADIANHFEEQCGATWSEVMEVVESLQQSEMVAVNVMVDSVMLTEKGKQAIAS
ncbi:MAG: hypothetical protein FJ196_02435 [Gammaproteobacteria bacterium]|nr:hypothetical protein [Gammaproteobacteria bacterium]